MFNGIERRQHKRIYKPFMASFRVTSQTNPFSIKSSWNIVTVKNLSAGGALFLYNSRLQENSEVDLKINFPLSKNSIDCSGKIVRIDDQAIRHIFGIAVQFSKIQGEDQKLINKFADQV